MSNEYARYLSDHIQNTRKAAKWMADHGMMEPTVRNRLLDHVIFHDKSKSDPEEASAYDKYFYGNKEDPEVKKAFDYAWLHHIHNNPHHWQHWVLINDDDGTYALEMPPEYVYEMIADWWSFSWKSGNLYEIFDWYADHSGKMILHENTRKLVDKTLDEIENLLNLEKDGSNT